MSAEVRATIAELLLAIEHGRYRYEQVHVEADLRYLNELLSSSSADDDVRPWQPGDGDTRCQGCGHTYEPWFTDNTLWNEVMGGSAYEGDPGGYLCPRCFTKRAAAVFPRLIWRVIPNWNGRAEPMDWPIADGGCAQ